MDDKVELLQRRLERERLARKQAEMIIEEKSRELYYKNQELERAVKAEHLARKEADLLRQSLEAFTSKLDIDEIASQLKSILMQLVPHDHSAVYLFKGGVLAPCGQAQGSDKGGDGATVCTPSLSPNGARPSARPIIIPNAQNDPQAKPWGVHPDSETLMVVHLFAPGRVVGCLILESRQADAFTPTAARLAQAIANEASIAFENSLLYREVERLSALDALTGINNRRQFDLLANVEFQMDLDHFKRVNDTHGHSVGDKVLVAVADVCRRALRTEDILARYGGEEFCFVLPQTDAKGAHAFAERIRIAIEGLAFDSNGRAFSVTASFGVSERIAEDDSPGSILERSDQALYEAKGGGRNRVVIWKPPEPQIEALPQAK
ncbi:MAG: sensor domain-containing diguanylate cyclase [Proteobacteria bacterium]|nr:sensor domain-containing diguanylate cyclase [Pseudomonadota bacterium]MBU4384487.1 sensor domain-containing diguanylate cyclase [Pseudomonadota bacterium]MCG2766364.1 sensor domain-containing diguanylate cyclase [Desulfarculaceae bacterium]